MWFFFNRRNLMLRHQMAERLHKERLAEIDRGIASIHSGEEKEKALLKTRERLADANENLMMAASDGEREQAERHVAELTAREREIIAREERCLVRYERQRERIDSEVKREQKLEEIPSGRQGVKERVESLRIKANELETKRAAAIAEQQAQEETKKELRTIDTETMQEMRRLADLKKEDDELLRELFRRQTGGLIAKLRCSEKELLGGREIKRKKMKDVRDLLTRLLQKRSQVRRVSRSRVICLECALQDAAAGKKTERDVLDVQQEIARMQELVADIETMTNEHVRTKNALTAAENDFAIVEIQIEIAKLLGKIDRSKISDLASRRRIATLKNKIISVSGECERELLELQLGEINMEPQPPDSPVLAKPAQWEKKEPTSPWCPAEVRPHLPFAASFEYQNDCSWENDSFPGWKIVAATRRGRMHAHHGTHREDAFLAVSGGNFILACISDGAGSCKYSRIGSETTCREVTRRLKTRIEGAKDEFGAMDERRTAKQLAEMINLSVSESCGFLRELAGKAGCQQNDFRCTLIVVLLYKNQEFELISICQVGDGFVAGVNCQGIATRYGGSDSGAFSGEVGCFVPDDNAPRKAFDSIELFNATDLEALILCSDGVEDPFYPVSKNASHIFQQLYQGVSAPLEGFVSQATHGPIIGAVEAKEHLEDWLNFEKKGENDDRTILVLHRKPSSFNGSKIVFR